MFVGAALRGRPAYVRSGGAATECRPYKLKPEEVPLMVAKIGGIE